jgi:transcriptional regulator with XRE-family HTH domain
MVLPTGNMLRAARALAGLKGTELADLAGVNQATISRMENFGRKTVGGHAGTVDAVVRALAQKGVEIVGDDTLRLTKRPRR